MQDSERIKISFGTREYILNPNQEKFFLSNKKYVGYIGGRGCGKTLALILKIIFLMQKYPKNYGLLGREDYADLRDSTEKDFLDICPKDYIKSYQKQEHKITFHNESILIFRGLKDVSKESIRSLNLGFFALEQAEEIEESLVDELSGCLRRDIKDIDGVSGIQQCFILANPAMNWIFKRFRQEGNPDYDFVPGSMMDNSEHLSESFLKDQMSKPERWKKVMVYGQFDMDILSDRRVFMPELLAKQCWTKIPIRTTIDGIEIYEEPINMGLYQIGADPTEGIEDSCSAKCVNTVTGREVASFIGRIAPDAFAEKVVKMGEIFNNAKVVPEINGIGLALLDKLKALNYGNIYMREEFDKIAKVMTQKLGWKTTPATKPLLIGHLNELLEKGFAKVSDERTIEEMRAFIYSDEAKKKGMGAERGFHDDRVMATALAYWQLRAIAEDEGSLVMGGEDEPQDKPRLYLEEILNRDRESVSWLQF